MFFFTVFTSFFALRLFGCRLSADFSEPSTANTCRSSRAPCTICPYDRVHISMTRLVNPFPKQQQHATAMAGCLDVGAEQVQTGFACPLSRCRLSVEPRRRERRLRQFLRHERLTVAMLLAETNHHAAPRAQTMARSGEWVRGAPHGDVPGEPKNPARGSATSTTTACWSFGERGLTASLTSGCRNGFSGTVWSRSSTPRLVCRCSMFLCR